MSFSCAALSSATSASVIASASLCASRNDLTAAISASTADLSAASTESPTCFNASSVWNTKLSASFLASIASFLFLSCASNSAASLTALSISSSDILDPAVIVMCCSFPVPRSFADTFTIPFASISNVTSICGTPRRAGGIPSSLNCPSDLLSRANCLSPCTTLISTAVWLSAAVENIWLFLVGIVVFLSISLVATPPIVSIERESGVTSRRSTSPAPASPASLPPWIEAPIATHSSGLRDLLGSFPVICFTLSCTAGIRVEPPTSNTCPRSAFVTPASFIAFCTGIAVLSTRSCVSSSNLALVRVMSKCFGPSAVAVMNGRLMFVVVAEDSSFFAFSAASFNLWSAILSVERSTPSAFLNSSIIHCVTLLSKSSPPRCVSPFVDNTSMTPSPISMIDTSNVPPPRS